MSYLYDGPYYSDEHIVTVEEMGKYALTSNQFLLGSYQPSQAVAWDFLQFYAYEHVVLDRLFVQKYKNFYYYDQTGNEDAEEVYDRFTDATSSFFMANEMKYGQLYWLELYGNNSLNTMDNIFRDFTISEQKQGERVLDREYGSGQRQDSTDNTYDPYTDTTTEQVMAYNSSTFSDSARTSLSKGLESTSSVFTKGAQTDTEDASETEEHTIQTSGSKGNMYDNMQKFITAWDAYSFYGKMFEDIAKEFLLI